MKDIALQEFLECYQPLCNGCTPYPCGELKNILGNIIWDRRDYSRIASNLHSKTIWTILQDDSSYYIIPTVTQSMASELVGYIVTEVPYHSNDISNMKVVINKEDYDEGNLSS